MARDLYDSIVVGARCAGSPMAMLLARKGYKVLLLDKERFPSVVRWPPIRSRGGRLPTEFFSEQNVKRIFAAAS